MDKLEATTIARADLSDLIETEVIVKKEALRAKSNTHKLDSSFVYHTSQKSENAVKSSEIENVDIILIDETKNVCVMVSIDDDIINEVSQ
jgi:hypothetical protein